MNLQLKSVSRDGKCYHGVGTLPPYHRRRVYELVYASGEWELRYTEYGVVNPVGVFAAVGDVPRGTVLGIPAALFIRPSRADVAIGPIESDITDAA